MTLRAVLSLLAVVFTAARSVPQILRLATIGVAGVSLGSWATALATSSAWLTYGLSASLIAVWSVNVWVAISSLWITARLAVTSRRNAAIAAFAVCAAAILSGATVLFPIVVTAALAALDITGLVPQVRALYVSRDVSGVAVSTWALTAAAQICWGLYWFVEQRLDLVGACIAGLTLTTWIILRTRQLQRTPPGPLSIDPATP